MTRTKILALVMAGAVVVSGAAVAVPSIADSIASAASPSPTAQAPIQVVGYAEAGSTSAATLKKSAAALTMVGIDGVNLVPDGSGITATSAEALTLLGLAKKQGDDAELLVGNFDGAAGDFSPEIAARLLSSSDNIDSVTDELAAEAFANGWDGITVDFESLTADDTAGLSSFMHELRTKLGDDKSLSICLMATTGDYADVGYDLEALGEAADHVVLMAYDQHGPTWTKSGAIGGLPWVKKTLVPLTRTIASEKIQLGIAGYGYSWLPKSQKGKTGKQYSDTAARALVKKHKAKAVWSTTQQEWHAKLKNGTVIWWSDARSYRARAALAAELDLGGVAVWSLGLSDPLT